MASRRQNKKSVSKLNKQKKLANIRAKYGPSMKAAPVIVKRVEDSMSVSESDDTMTPREHLEDIKQRWMAATISLEEARAADNFWRRRMTQEAKNG